MATPKQFFSVAAILLVCASVSKANYASAYAQVTSCPDGHSMYCCGTTYHVASAGAQTLAGMFEVDTSSAGEHVGLDCYLPPTEGCLRKAPVCCSGSLASATANSDGMHSAHAMSYVTNCQKLPGQNRD